MADHTHPEHPTALIPDLLKLFYSLGWVTGTGGGLSVKHEYSPPRSRYHFLINKIQ
jgi:ribulose-5-phosphate 4-epimerase/fuculose-1-phosphate aldolase